MRSARCRLPLACRCSPTKMRLAETLTDALADKGNATSPGPSQTPLRGLVHADRWQAKRRRSIVQLFQKGRSRHDRPRRRRPGRLHRRRGYCRATCPNACAHIRGPNNRVFGCRLGARTKAIAGTRGANAYRSHQDMLIKDLHAVYICVPPFAHGEPEHALIDAGLPFFVEKPLSLDIAPLTRLPRASAQRADGVGYHWRYLDTVEEARGFYPTILQGWSPAIGSTRRHRHCGGGTIDPVARLSSKRRTSST